MNYRAYDLFRSFQCFIKTTIVSGTKLSHCDTCCARVINRISQSVRQPPQGLADTLLLNLLQNQFIPATKMASIYLQTESNMTKILNNFFYILIQMTTTKTVKVKYTRLPTLVIYCSLIKY
jgi:hypothetical protein